MSSPRVGMVHTKVRSMTTKDAQGLLNFRRAACGIDSFSRGSTSVGSRIVSPRVQGVGKAENSLSITTAVEGTAIQLAPESRRPAMGHHSGDHSGDTLIWTRASNSRHVLSFLATGA